MKRVFCGFPIDWALYAEAKKFFSTLGTLNPEELPAARKEVFELISRFVISGVTSFYTKPIQGHLAPLPPGRSAEDAIQSISLGLTLVLSTYFQSPSRTDLQDFGIYLSELLRLHPERQEPFLAYPLEEELHQQVQQVFDLIRSNSSREAYQKDVLQLVLNIAEAGTVHYYQYPSAYIALDSDAERSVRGSLREVSRSISLIAHHVVTSLSHTEMLYLVQYMEAMTFEPMDESTSS